MEQTQSNPRRRGGRRRGGRRGGPHSRGRHQHRGSQPAKKQNPILAFFTKLFGGKPKASETRREDRPARPERERAPRPPREESAAIPSGAESETRPEVTTEKLYIGNLSYDASESDLFDMFAKVGTVKNVEIVRDRNGRSKGFGFVVMNTLDSAKEASEKFHRTDFLGRQIVVAGSKN